MTSALDDLTVELIKGQRLAADEDGRRAGLDRGGCCTRCSRLPSRPPRHPWPTRPPYLAEKILTSRSALEGERKQVTVLFADLKGNTELIRDLDPEAGQTLLDTALHLMMDAVHRFEGTVNDVAGDGLMAMFGAPIAHEDHALRACYAALAMQAALRRYAEDVRRTQGLEVLLRVGLNSGDVLVRTISNDLYMNYSGVGLTTNLAARMEQLAPPGTIRVTAATLRLVEGAVRVNALGPIPVKGLAEPVEVFELVGATPVHRRLQAAVARGLTRFVGRASGAGGADSRRWRRPGTGQGQLVALLGEAGVGKSRLVYELIHSHTTQGWRVLESASVSYGRATPYFPVIDLLKRYAHVEDTDDARTIRAKVTGQVLTLDETLQDTLPALLALLDVLPDDSPFRQLDPPQRRQRTLTALKRVLLRESQVQPLLLVFEDLHWMDTETQALLDSLVESLPTARLLLLVNYRPEYQHGWGSKTYYTQLRLDPLPPASADEFLQALLGDDPSLAAAHAAADRPHGGQSLLPGRERAHPGGDGRAGRASRGPIAWRRPSTACRCPPRCRRCWRRASTGCRPEEKRLLQTAAVIGTEVPLPLLQAIAELPEDSAAPRPGAPPGRRVPLRDPPVPRARLHLQACPDARGGLRQPAPGAAAGAARPHRRGHRRARWRPGGRAGRTPGAPCPAGRGVGQGPGVLPAGGGEGHGAVGLPRGRGVLRAGAQCPPASAGDSATHASRPSISGSPCARRSCRRRLWAYPGAAARGRGPRRRPSTTRVGWDRSRRFLSYHFYFMGAYDQAIAAAQRALALATAGGDVVLQALAHRYLGIAYHAQGDYRRAIDCLRQTMAFFDGAQRHERFGQVILPAVTSRA